MRKLPLVLLALLVSGLGTAPVQAISDEAIARNSLGAELLEQERLDEAIVEFQRAVELDLEYAAARLNLAYAYDRKGRLDEAMAEYRKAIEMEPGNLFAHNNLGVLYDKKGLYDEAIGEFEKALRIDPSNATALENLENAKRSKANIQEREGRIAEAQKDVEAHPNDPRAAYNLARLYAFYGEKDQALEWLAKALELGFDDFKFLDADLALEGLREDPRFPTWGGDLQEGTRYR